MRVAWQIPDDASNGNVGLAHQVQGLADRVVVPEVTRNRTFGHHDVCWPCQRGPGIAANEFEIEKIENVRISDNHVFFTRLNVTT